MNETIKGNLDGVTESNPTSGSDLNDGSIDVMANTQGETTPSTSSTDTETGLSSLTDDQLLSAIQGRQNFKIPVKVNGKDESVSFNEYQNRISHQSATSRQMSEAKDLQDKYDTAWTDLKYHANGTTDQKIELLEALGMDATSLRNQKQQEADDYDLMTDEGKQIVGLKGTIGKLESKLEAIENRQSSSEASIEERQLRSEFSNVAKDYPTMEDPKLQQFAAFLMSENQRLSTNDAFRQVSEMVGDSVKKQFNDYVSKKKADASNSVLGGGGGGGSPIVMKDIMDKKSPVQRLQAMLK